jgi:hypothetical protein
MSIAAESCRCRDGFQKNVSNFTAATVLNQKYWYQTIRFIQSQDVSLVNTKILSNACTFSMFSKERVPRPHRCRDEFLKNLPLPRRHGHLCYIISNDSKNNQTFLFSFLQLNKSKIF